jgi:hypothetical protein
MNSWLSRTQIRQRPMLAVYAGLLILIAVVIGLAALKWLTSPSGDRLVVIGNLLSLGTLLLALVAGIVALAAYSAATGSPDLKVKFTLEMVNPNEAIFFFSLAADQGDGLANSLANIVVQNTSKYAARNPAVIIEVRGCWLDPEYYVPSPPWTPTTRHPTQGAVQTLQWDGGPSYAIHGNSLRHLPELSLRGLVADGERTPAIVISLLADGYNRPDILLPIKFMNSLDIAPFFQRAGPPEWM